MMSEEQTKQLPSVSEDQLVEALDAAKNVAAVNNPEDMAAAFFSLSEPRFLTLTSKMSSREISRAVRFAIMHPFGKKHITLLTQNEKDLAYLISEMIMHKMIMQLHYETKKVEEAQKRQDEAQAAEETSIVESQVVANE